MKLFIPTGYRPALDVRRTEEAIPRIKSYFERSLAENLRLERASAPLFVRKGTGINDDLNGVERKVSFDIMDGAMDVEVVNSLAKWKRMALARYGYGQGEGIWTDMNAIRRDEELDNLHSVYVDQWDWERVVSRAERTVEFLRSVVDRIYDAMKRTEMMIFDRYGVEPALPERMGYVTTHQLEEAHPHLSRKERENVAVREAGALFLMKIGGRLKDGKPHDGRAPDYDDWELNGDIIVWNPVLESALELSSMGIRVDRDALLRQLREANAMERLELEFHRMLMNGELPLSVGGGIGQSRTCMFLLRKAHIGEVQASVWPEEMVSELARHGVKLL